MANDYEYKGKAPTPWTINRELKIARRLYAAGHYKKAAQRARRVFQMTQHLQAEEEQAFVNAMKPVVELMESTNALLKELVTHHKEEAKADE